MRAARLRWGWALLLIGIVLAAAYPVRNPRRGDAELPTEAALPVDVATVVREEVPIVVQALGTVQPIESRRTCSPGSTARSWGSISGKGTR